MKFPFPWEENAIPFLENLGRLIKKVFLFSKERIVNFETF
jgi:hypothetical protein